MGKDAPDERAQKLADKIMGKPATDRSVIEMLSKNVSVGQRDEEGRPTGEKVTAEEFRAGNRASSKPTRADADTDDDDEFDPAEDDEDEEGGDGEEEPDTEEETDDELDTDPDEGEEEGDDGEEEDDDDEEEGDDYEVSDYNDEDTLEVKVDGEVKEVSLRELKRVYSLNEATEKRLKEATEARNAANADRDAVHTEIQQNRANMLRTIQQLDGVLFQPLINEPDPKLRAKNMQEYLLQKDAWEEDQKRITQGRTELTQFLAQEHQKMQQGRATFRQTQQELLAQKMPDLLDPEKSQKVQKDIMDAATYYGFTPEMVADVDHHGLFLMARDAARWLNMQKIKKSGKVPTNGEGKIKRKRHLRAGTGPTSTKLGLVRSQKQQAAATKRAQETGRVDDVTAMLVSKARTRSKTNGRRG